MRLLLLSFYYRPDLSAGSFRASTLVDALLAILPDGASIDVITTAPNRYSTFTQEVTAVETAGPLTIRRIALPAHRSDLWDNRARFCTLRVAQTATLRMYHTTSCSPPHRGS